MRMFVGTCGGNNWLDICMPEEGFHALFLAHIEYHTLLYQVMHLYFHHYDHQN